MLFRCLTVCQSSKVLANAEVCSPDRAVGAGGHSARAAAGATAGAAAVNSAMWVLPGGSLGCCKEGVAGNSSAVVPVGGLAAGHHSTCSESGALG